jgi:hypothetical protein
MWVCVGVVWVLMGWTLGQWVWWVGVDPRASVSGGPYKYSKGENPLHEDAFPW